MACPSTPGATLATQRYSGDVHAHCHLKPTRGVSSLHLIFTPLAASPRASSLYAPFLHTPLKRQDGHAWLGAKGFTSYATLGSEEVYIPEEDESMTALALAAPNGRADVCAFPVGCCALALGEIDH